MLQDPVPKEKMFTLFLHLVFYLLKIIKLQKKKSTGLCHEVCVFGKLVQVKGTDPAAPQLVLCPLKGGWAAVLWRWSSAEMHGCLPGMTETDLSSCHVPAAFSLFPNVVALLPRGQMATGWKTETLCLNIPVSLQAGIFQSLRQSSR